MQRGDVVITTGNHKLIEKSVVKVVNQGENDSIPMRTKANKDSVAIKLVSPAEVKIGDAEFIFKIVDSKTQKPLKIENLEKKKQQCR